MVDFAKLLERRWIAEGKDPKIERERISLAREKEEAGKVAGKATRVLYGRLDWKKDRDEDALRQPVDVKFRIKGVDDKGDPVLALEPGVTGYEAFSWKSLWKTVQKENRQIIWFCAGTRGRWDGLFVERPELERVVKALGLPL